MPVPTQGFFGRQNNVLNAGKRKGNSSINFIVNWFCDNVQVEMFVEEHKGGMKINGNLLNRRLIVCIVRPQNIL